ncbi:MAG TPA: hypothetical protein VMU34_13960 [Mycobacterium sp.]|nr:hypothetical protein [Mycobacterium sp.]
MRVGGALHTAGQAVVGAQERLRHIATILPRLGPGVQNREFCGTDAAGVRLPRASPIPKLPNRCPWALLPPFQAPGPLPALGPASAGPVPPAGSPPFQNPGTLPLPDPGLPCPLLSSINRCCAVKLPTVGLAFYLLPLIVAGLALGTLVDIFLFALWCAAAQEKGPAHRQSEPLESL